MTFCFIEVIYFILLVNQKLGKIYIKAMTKETTVEPQDDADCVFEPKQAGYFVKQLLAQL